MINEMTMIIPGVPIAKKRPRFARRGKFVTTYNDQQTEEGRWLLSARDSFRKNGLMEPLSAPVSIKMTFFMPIPGSTTKKRLGEMRENPAHTKKPDLDNCVKFALDCLNGELFKDDSLVYHIEAVKLYSSAPGTAITVQW